MVSARPAFLEAVERLRSWADSIPVDRRHGEWECGFQEWGDLYTAWDNFLETALPSTWTQLEISAAIYALARDNEAEYLAGSLERLDDQEILLLADAAIRDGERDARWQIADVLGRPRPAREFGDRVEAALLRFAGDREEYVRRRALQSLARRGSHHAERIALAAWNEEGESAPWTRMNALWALKEIRSTSLDRLLREAMMSENQYLREFATNLDQET